MKANQIIIMIITLMSILFLSTPALAVDYMAKVEVRTVQGSPLAWSSPIIFYLNTTETKNVGNIGIHLNEISNSNNQALFTISGGTHTLSVLNIGGTDCLLGQCNENGSTPTHSGDVRMALISIEAKTTSSSNYNYSSGDAVDIYLKPDSSTRINIPINDPTATFDIIQFNQKSGWTSSTSQKDIPLYVHRNYGSISISVNTDGNIDDMKQIDGDVDTMYYILKSNTKYEFKVKSTTTGTWASEKTNTYTLNLKGLATSSAQPTTVVPVAPYDVVLGRTKNMPMSEPGDFAPVNGVTISKLSPTVHDLTFSNVGTFTLAYNTAKGSQQYVFVVNPPVQTTPSVTVSANQAQGMTAGGIDNNYLLGGLGILAIAGIFYIRNQKRGGGGGSSHYSAGKNLG